LDKTQVELLWGYLEKARGKLWVARELVERGEWDDAVSRAYYAAFHSAQAALLTEGSGGILISSSDPVRVASGEDGQVRSQMGPSAGQFEG